MSQPLSQASRQFDPINSPHPVPWNWVMAALSGDREPHDLSVNSEPNNEPHDQELARNHATTTTTPAAKVYGYRSPSLISPDSQYAAYSRIQVHVHPQFVLSQVSSVLFVENLATGDRQTITPTSPLSGISLPEPEASRSTASRSEGSSWQISLTEPMWSNAPGAEASGQSPGPSAPGMISIMMPVSWSEDSDRLLARTFESVFCSDLASDYAVVVNRTSHQVSTFAPSHLHYATAVLLGWSATLPDQVLFRMGNLGDEDWTLHTVNTAGRTKVAAGDRPRIYGQIASHLWMGPHAEN